MYAQRSAQEAYVERLQRMTVEQLIAEVMRVQIAAAELIKQEVANTRASCIAALRANREEDGDGQHGEWYKGIDSCIITLEQLGEESVTH